MKASAVPLSEMVCGLPLPLEVSVMVPDCAPSAVGLKPTLIWQLAPAASVPPQPLPMLNCDGDGEMLTVVNVTEAPLELLLVTVMACVALLVPITWLPKLRLVDDKVKVPAGGLVTRPASTWSQPPIAAGCA